VATYGVAGFVHGRRRAMMRHNIQYVVVASVPGAQSFDHPSAIKVSDRDRRLLRFYPNSQGLLADQTVRQAVSASRGSDDDHDI